MFWTSFDGQPALECANGVTTNPPDSNLTLQVIQSLVSPSVTLDLRGAGLFGLPSSDEAQFRLGPLPRGAGVNVDRKGLSGSIDEGSKGESQPQEVPQEHAAEDNPSDG